MIKDSEGRVKVHWKVMLLILIASALALILSAVSYFFLDNAKAFQVSLNVIKNFFVPIGLAFFIYSWVFPERCKD
jgi:hypothetical protein